jgi:uncharacterized membrane protein
MPDVTPQAILETRQERTESARLDNFVDGAFAFAITLLVISGASLPQNVAALEHALRGVPAFAACFAQLAWFWYAHVRWRDSVRLTDSTSLLLSLLLVFFALIFVFPLHLVFGAMFHGISHGELSTGSYSTAAGFGLHDTAALFVCYGLSFACMAGTLCALYVHGVRAADGRTRDESVRLRVKAATWGFVATIGVLSMLMAMILPARAGWVVGVPGFSYLLLSLTGPVTHHYRKHLEATLPS